jgi:hypothetical protein
MMSFKGTPHAAQRQSKPPRQKKKSRYLPPADGRPVIKLPRAGLESMLTIGREAAERYLDEGEQLLPEFWAGLRRMAPPQHLEDIEAGFLGRLDQRIRSLPAPEQSCEAEQEAGLAGVVALKGAGRAPLAVGAAVLSTLLKQLEQVGAMADTGAIQATSSEGAQQLRRVQELLGSVTLIGTGARAHG